MIFPFSLSCVHVNIIWIFLLYLSLSHSHSHSLSRQSSCYCMINIALSLSHKVFIFFIFIKNKIRFFQIKGLKVWMVYFMSKVVIWSQNHNKVIIIPLWTAYFSDHKLVQGGRISHKMLSKKFPSMLHSLPQYVYCELVPKGMTLCLCNTYTQ